MALPATRFFSVLCGLLLVAQSAAAQSSQPARQIFTLDDAITFAKDHQPRIKEALRQIVVEQRAASVPRSQWVPQITGGAELVGGTVNTTTASFFAIPDVAVARVSSVAAVRDSELQPYPSTFAGVSVRQEVFEFGKFAAQAAVEDALADAAKANSDLVMLNLRYSVEEAYFSVLASKAIVRASEEAYTRAKVHRDLAFAGVKSGLRDPIELTRAEAQLGRIDAGRIRAHGGLETAWVALAATMGAPEINVDTTENAPELGALPPLAEGLDRAVHRDPTLHIVESQLNSQRLEAKAIWAEYRPEFYLQGELFGFAGGVPPNGNPTPVGDGWVPSVANYAVALVLRIPILDMTVVSRSRVAVARERVLESQLNVTELRVNEVVRQAYVRRDVAVAAIPSLEHALNAAQDNWAQADARFRAGLGTSVELADAEAIREDADIQLALGHFDVARARSGLARAIVEGL
jgi:outer membrane protein TolC